MSDEEWGGLGDDGYDGIHEFDPGRRNPERCAECGRPEDDHDHA